MLTDYHVHIERGPYSFDWLDQFIETAMKQHVAEIGIVEHSHRFQEMTSLYANLIQDETPLGQYQKSWLTTRLGQTTLSAYSEFIREAKKRGYPVKMGLEICYMPEFEEETHKLLKLIEPDFIIGSVHWLNGWGFDHPVTRAEWAGRNKAQVAEEYNRLLIKAIRSGLFDIIGHIDCIKAFSPWEVDNWLQNEVIEELHAAGLTVEVNTGVKYRVNCSEYCPGDKFLRACFDSGIAITLASDAHDPADVGRLFSEALAQVTQAGYYESTRFTLRQKYPVEL